MVFHSSTYHSSDEAREALQAIVVVSPRGNVQFATPRAVTWLKDVLGAARVPERLPMSICRWVNNVAVNANAKPFILGTGGGRLRIDFLYREESSVCLVLEKLDDREAGSPPSGRPLTKREREVLAWVARGKANSEIATILRVGTRTIDKHVERILAKLGVENRTAAASHVGIGRAAA